ncbi:MAG: hypothetical protein VYC34_02750 [Planctomycetota bacterium]|nr:hypothetical protein [Planctomycetota bacterium]
MKARFALILLAAAATAPLAAAQDRIVVFVFDQSADNLLRIEDINNNGVTTDPGEVVRYFAGAVPLTGVTNAQGLYALDAKTVLATDNFVPDNVILLSDTSGDNDALDGGESSVWWNGMIPVGVGMLTNPVNLTRGPGGAYYIIDNNTLDTTNPEAVYRVEDQNNDNDVNDPGEVQLYFQLSPVGVSNTTTFDIEFDAAGAGYVVDITDPNQIESIDRIDPTASFKTEWVSSSTLFALTNLIIFSSFELTYNPNTDEIIAPLADGFSGLSRIVGLCDRNGSNTINAANEVRLLWGEGLNADGVAGSPRDLFYYEGDGSIVFVDSGDDTVIRLYDANGDGDYNDLGETTVIYDSAIASANGQPAAEGLLSVAVARADIPCPADLDGDGQVGPADLGALLGSWGMMGVPADFDGGGVGPSDLGTLLGSWGPCP